MKTLIQGGRQLGKTKALAEAATGLLPIERIVTPLWRNMSLCCLCSSTANIHMVVPIRPASLRISYITKCMACDAVGPVASTVSKARKAWNRQNP